MFMKLLIFLVEQNLKASQRQSISRKFSPKTSLKTLLNCFVLNTHIPHISCILGFEKTKLPKNCASGTVLMIQLTRNSPTCSYISQNPRKWKLR